MKNAGTVLVLATVLMMFTSLAIAQQNPCNPSGSKNTFHVHDATGLNTVVFKSTAPLEDIVGTSSGVKGYLCFDPKNPSNGAHGEFSIPVGSFKTGIPMRDEHIQRADWLDAKSYPNITLTVKTVNDVQEVKSSSEYNTFEGTVVADISFHGKSKTIQFLGKLTFLKESEKTRAKLPGDLVAAKADFEIKLADFGVTGPKGMDLIGSKVGETIAIEVSLMGSNASGSMAEDPGNQ